MLTTPDATLSRPPPACTAQACEPVLKTLLSAAANAKQNLGLRKAKLVVSECYADEGPVLKRAQPRAQVRAPCHCVWGSGWSSPSAEACAVVHRTYTPMLLPLCLL